MPGYKFKIPVSFKPYKTIRNIMRHPKDPLPKEHRSGVMSKISCKECDREYIREIGRQLRTRTREVQADVSLGRTKRSALPEHSIATGHEIDWKGVEIMEMEENWCRRKTKESWNIKFGKQSLNSDEGTLEESYDIVI